MTDNRKPVPDLLKGIAVLAMIQVHVMELFARPEILSSPLGKVSLFIGGPMAAPVFLAVMGYFLAQSDKSKSKMARRGVSLIILGFLLNIGLNAHVLIKIWNGTFDLNPLEFIFGADILFVAGLSILTIALLQDLLKRFPFGAFIPAMLIPLIAPYIPDLPHEMRYLQAFIYGDLSWSYFPVFPWMAYPFLGYGIFRLQTSNAIFTNMSRDRQGLIIILSVIINALLFNRAYFQITSLQEYYHHGLFLFVWISIFLVFYSLIIRLADQFFGASKVFSFLKWLGKNVTLIYIIQWLIIGNIATSIYKTQEIGYVIIWMPVVLALSSGLGYIVTLVRPHLIGKNAG